MKTKPMNTLTPTGDQRRAYDAPQLELCQICIERGFADSFHSEHEGFVEDWDEDDEE